MTVHSLPGGQNGRWLGPGFLDSFSLVAYEELLAPALSARAGDCLLERRNRMLRTIAGLAALLFAAGLTVAAQDAKQDAKKLNYVYGFFESYKSETLTLKVDTKEQKFKVPGDTQVGYADGKNKTKVLKAKVHLKDVKKGSTVSVTLDSDGKKVLAVGVLVSELPKDKPTDEDKDK
jgi:hypothetical protein